MSRAVTKFVIGVLLLLVWNPRSAHAGCPNTCAATASITVTPPLACADTKATPQTCDCRAFVTVGNQCADPLDATDFVFGSCAAGTQHDCVSLAPHTDGAVDFSVERKGHYDWALHLHAADGDHVATVTLDVTAFDGSPGGCGVSPSRRSRGAAAALSAMGLVALAERRRRKNGDHLRSNR